MYMSQSPIEPLDSLFQADPFHFVETAHIETKLATMENERRLEREEERKEIRVLNMSIATLTAKVEELKSMLDQQQPPPPAAAAAVLTGPTAPRRRATTKTTTQSRSIICAILEVIHQVITKPTPQVANIVHFMLFQSDYLIIASGGLKLLAEIITDILGQVCGPSQIQCEENML